jgi:hypothetical protein
VRTQDPAGALPGLSKGGAANKTLAGILGAALAQLLADAADAEETGHVKLAIELYERAEAELQKLEEDPATNPSAVKRKKMAKGERYECRSKLRTLRSQLESRSRALAPHLLGIRAVAGLTSSTAALTRGGVAGTARAGRAVTVGTVKALRHNVLSDALGASTRRYVLAAPRRVIRRPRFGRSLPLRKAALQFLGSDSMAGLAESR